MVEINKEDREHELVTNINDKLYSGDSIDATLTTDGKVLARITDGIYRLPGSAIRELITNAYDADAENVSIDMDLPAFETIVVRDDGNGMSIDTLVNLIHHIGGSAKRNTKGQNLHITNENDPTISPKKGRKLIGKIGIGLFSVAQLTRDFEIITKEEGKDYYLKASVTLNNYSELSENGRGADFESGKVRIWTERTTNATAHGTDIILKNIRKNVRDQLKSEEIWSQYFDDELSDSEKSKINTPSWHIGYVRKNKNNYDFSYDAMKPKYPWDIDASPQTRFSQFYQRMIGLTSVTTNPKLGINLDNYLEMLWTLALSVPLKYIDRHPFDYKINEIREVYKLSNLPKGQVEDVVNEGSNKTIRDILELKNDKKNNDTFNVIIDGTQLFRPLRFTDLPKSTSVVKDPMLFIGNYDSDFPESKLTELAGNISFSAYILWTPKVIPKDHNGILIRIQNASGILFDETFMKNQVSEHTIKSQLTAEIFVTKGLDAALNIDRESFNVSHPHYQIIMRWLHNALRQTVNRFKKRRTELLSQKRSSENSERLNEIKELIYNVAAKNGVENDSLPIFLKEYEPGKFKTLYGKNYDESEVPLEGIVLQNSDFIFKENDSKFIKTEALMQVLFSYNLLSDISPDDQYRLIQDIYSLLNKN